MRRRPLSAVLTLVLLLQALVVAPTAFASCAGMHHSPAHSVLADGMAGEDEHCPCCPEGAMTAGDCVTACMSFAMSSPASSAFAFQAPATVTTPFVAHPFPTQTYAPLNPPPIG